MSHAAVLLLLALAAPIAPSARDGGVRGRFILGTAERLAMAGDHQQPRRYERIESAVDAYADVDEVADPTWLRHELDGYVRRAADCSSSRTHPCGRSERRLGSATVFQVTRGVQAEILWTSARYAVRLAWRREVETRRGMLHLDEPPADFAASLLDEFPSDLAPHPTDDERWADDEIDRRLDYAARALDGCAGEPDTTQCLYFARASLLAVAAAETSSGGEMPPPAMAATVISVRLQVAAAQLRRAGARQSLLAAPWCAAPPRSEASRLAQLP